MKIQINSLEALERMIGGDNQIEIDIRHSIVEAFTKKYLKAIANTDLLQKSERAIKQEVAGMFKKVDWNKVELEDKHKELIHEAVDLKIRLAISSEVNKAVEKYVKERVTPEIIKEKVDSLVHHTIATQVRKEITSKLNEVLK